MRKVLSKSQMSMIKGGKPTAWLCKAVLDMVFIEDNPILIGPEEEVYAETATEAAQKLHDKYGAGQVNCTKARS